jgi:hypothetical protein
MSGYQSPCPQRRSNAKEIELLVPRDSPLGAHEIIPLGALRGIPVATVDRSTELSCPKHSIWGSAKQELK